MKVLSLFDGISCGRVALERAGIPVETYYASEIDKYTMTVAQAMYPDTIQIGDVCKIDFTQYVGKVDMIIGGSPCQDLSIAKQNRQGLQGERSRLFWEYIKALKIVKPKYFLLENVASMKNEDRDAITAVLRDIYPETECIMINSALVSAQQRKRYYWTNWHVEQPQDNGILLKDILETASVAYQDKAHCLDANYYKGASLEHALTKHKRTQVLVPIGSEPMRIGKLAGRGNGQANRIYSVRGKSICLNANGGGGGAKTGLYKADLPDGDYIVRKLTPRECCRLQTYDERCFDVANISNTQWYKAFGNGWTVDVIAHILKQITTPEQKEQTND